MYQTQLKTFLGIKMFFCTGINTQKLNFFLKFLGCLVSYRARIRVLLEQKFAREKIEENLSEIEFFS